MKKVIVLLAVLAMVGSVSMAATLTASHSEDFGCGACHSAHVKVNPNDAANVTGVSVPLWGRTITTETLVGYDANDSGTLNTTNHLIVPGTPKNESLLCMSCHDGVTNNASGEAHEIDSTTNGVDGYVDTSIGHPISFAYATAGANANYNSTLETNDNVVAKLYQGNVECSTCHDIHGSNPNSTPGVDYAIRNANASASTNPTEAICLSCHIR